MTDRKTAHAMLMRCWQFVTVAVALLATGTSHAADDHPDRKHVEALTDAEITYDLVFVHEEDGRIAVENEDYRILERPSAMAHKISGRSPTNA